MKFLPLLFLLLLSPEVSALEIEAPPVPQAGRDWMPLTTDSLWEGLGELWEKAVCALGPELAESSQVCLAVTAAVLLVSVLKSFTAGKTAQLGGTVAIGVVLLGSTGSMMTLAADTIRELTAYGKLLLPVMTTALAAQGGVTTSAALYTGTAVFITLLQTAMGALLVPGIYLYLALGMGSAATGEVLLKRMGELLKGLLSWFLKILLMIFTTYLSLTHVISGATDAAALKATKVSVSTFVPVVGGVLSDASEAVLVGVGLLKNTAGIYGILAALALCLHPFLKIGVPYLMLKLTGGICALFDTGGMSGMIDRFTTAMGLLLAITGSGCIMVLISTVCFLKGVG